MRRALILCLAAFAGLTAARAAEAPAATMRPLRETPTHTVLDVRLTSPVETGNPAGDTIPAEYYLPRGIEPGSEPRPAVVCLHILNGNFELVRLMCSVLADRGIPAIWFPLPGYGPRGTREGRRAMLGDAARFTQALDRGMADLRRTVDFLASRPETDPEKIGVAGISLGAILGGAACGYEPRFSRACLILGGGDLPAIIASARETRGLRTSLEAMDEESREQVLASLREADPLTHAGRLAELAADGKLLLIRAENDEVVPPASTDKLVAAVGPAIRVETLAGAGHYTALASLPMVLRALGDFFAEDLPAGAAVPTATAAADRSPEEMLAGVAGGLAAFLTPVPEPGRCNLFGARIEFTPEGGDPRTADVDLAVGHGGRLRLECDVPDVGRLHLGEGEAPWMLSRGGTLFAGTGDPGEPVSGLFSPEALLRIRTTGAVLTAVSMAPQAFARQVSVTSSRGGDGRPRLHIRVTTRGDAVEGVVLFGPDERTPSRLEIRAGGASATVAVRRWVLNTPAAPELFEPPERETTVPVPATDLRRMFAATTEFLLRRIR